jgi:hypothetical protein
MSGRGRRSNFPIWVFVRASRGSVDPIFLSLCRGVFTMSKSYARALIVFFGHYGQYSL